MDLTYAYAGDVVKHERDSNGALLVYGKATGPDIDLDGQGCDPEWLRSAMPAWFRSGGNIREQHDSKRAVGTAIEHEITGSDDHMVRARIVDPVAIAKVEAGVLRGFSIGVKNAGISKSDSFPNGKIDRGAVCELSLVDRPCLPTAVFTMCKAAKPGMELNADDFDAESGLVRVEELVEKTDAPADEPVDVDIEKTDETDAPADEPDAPEAEKATDVDRLSDPAPGQTCTQCGEDGHLFCAPTGVDVPAGDIAVVDAALKAAAGVLVKSDGPGSEESDIDGARRAIAIIGGLIASEAADLPDMPEQSWDIRLLLQAASALHSFICNERDEELGEAIAGVQTVSLSADPDAEKAADADEAPAEGDVEKSDADTPADEAPVAAPVVDREHIDALVKAAVDAAMEQVLADLTKTLDEARTVVKAAEADTEKAAGAAPMTPDLVLKTVSTDLEDNESELRKMVSAIAEDSTTKAAEALKAFNARLDDVEQMARPGGPALRRTEVERTSARRGDLAAEAERLRALATAAHHDPDLRKGYAIQASRVEAELKALQ
jgi:hypothetical protein